MDKKLIKLSKSCIGKKEKKEILNVLDEEYLGMGKYVQKFENSLSVLFNRHVACVASGTSALQLAMQACNIHKGDEVLVPSITYVASFQAISANNAIPVACDVDPNTLIIDLVDAEKRITSKTKALMPVFYSGGVNGYEKIYKFAKKYNLRVIEDAAHAFGTSHSDSLIGSIGDVTCFSFDGIKNITSGEGGCVISNDKCMIDNVKDIRLLGVIKDTRERFLGKRSWEFDVQDQGWRYHMSNIMAAIGNIQLQRLGEFSNARRNVAKTYDKLFSNHSRIKILNRDYDDVVPHIYVVKIKNLKNRSILRKKMLEDGIETGIHYYPNHRLKKYYKEEVNLKNTDKYFPELLSLPMHPELNNKDINYIFECLNSRLKNIK